MALLNYITQADKRYRNGISKEHAYRGDLENLLRTLAPNVDVTNEPARVTDCGNPDFIITSGRIPVGYIEAKDIGKDLDSKLYKEQFTRYRRALDNLIITDYLWFRFFREDRLVHEIRIGEVRDGKIVPLEENFVPFENLIADFCTFTGQTIKSAQRLAELMAGKARLLQNILERAVTSDEKTEENTSLKGQLVAFRDVLIHDISPGEFADLYAQTLAYGMFAARLHDSTLEDFSRQEAAELIPKSNPFLRKLFQYIAGYDIDERIRTTVDNLADVFRAADVRAILQNFGQATRQTDPIIHFYETFLAEYDPKLRKSRGVWYTPEPVVKFIVRAVDDILKTDFGLAAGLADTSKTTITVEEQGAGVKKTKKEVHRVQILDPATGTGTFLAEVVRYIHSTRFAAMQGAWSKYVENELIPRLNGFELLMASYAMAHLKLELLLKETGYQAEKSQRLRVYLTNSLEEHHPDTGTLFAHWLSTEANEANHIKRDAPVMVVMGNPPYSVSSNNKGEWIKNLIADYKKDLNEQNINPLSDDYIKFIRYGQFFIEKNGKGLLAYISNNSFIDGIIHRQMRKNLLETFDKIYIIDLHGNAKRKETAPDGGKDENVFDIQQGVSINIFVKNSGRAKLAEVFHFDSYGKRQEKYDLLNSSTIKSIKWQKLKPQSPEFFLVPKDFESQKKYEQGFAVNELFGLMSSGIKTHRDHFVIDFDRQILEDRIKKFYDKSFTDQEICNLLQLKENKTWQLSVTRNLSKFNFTKLQLILYRPFDFRSIYYESTLIDRGREKVMRHIISGSLSFLCFRQSRNNEQGTFWISKTIVGKDAISSLDTCSVFPLYLYPSTDGQQSLDDDSSRKPNLDMNIVRQIAEKTGLRFTPEKENAENCFAPVDLLDYIYAVLHSPAYREKYREFLKIDFPRVPYPENAETFRRLAAFGAELRQIHLLESPQVEKYITAYPADGDNRITRKIVQKDWDLYDEENGLGRVWINDAQYFDKIPLIAWDFYIGGYQPAQKWLKDRSGKTLSFDDILHYQKIIVALAETARIMEAIDAA